MILIVSLALWLRWAVMLLIPRLIPKSLRDIAKILEGLLLVVAIVLLLLPKSACAQIPPDAAKYKHQLRQQAHLVWGIDAPISSFAAQIHQESRWNPAARSKVGALGMTQFMPATAAWISGIYPDLAQSDPTNPTWAMRDLLRYEKRLYDNTAAINPCERMAFAMSGYNGGIGWVLKRKARSEQPLICFDATCDINPGISPANQKENADYPRRILKRYEAVYVAAGWGAGVCT